MQQQEFGPDRRALQGLVLDEVTRTRVEMERAAVSVCDSLTWRRGYKAALTKFKQMDARRMALWARWDQLEKGGK